MLFEDANMELHTGAYKLSPVTGSNSGLHSTEIVDAIWDQLPLVENGGEWHYYNFTSTSAIFDSDTAGVNRLTIEFADSERGDKQSHLIHSMLIELDETERTHFNSLLKLTVLLQKKFHLTVQSLPTKEF